jgi:hypothetical protein
MQLLRNKTVLLCYLWQNIRALGQTFFADLSAVGGVKTKHRLNKNKKTFRLLVKKDKKI